MKAICPVCEKEFEKKHAGKIYCSQKCKSKEDNHKYFARNKTKEQTRNAAYRKEHPEKCRIYNATNRVRNKPAIVDYFKKRHEERRAWILGIKASLKCSRCDESRPMCLDFHHLDGSAKEHNISTMICKNHPKERILEEIAKCVVLCRNCHAVEHWKPVEWK